MKLDAFRSIRAIEQFCKRMGHLDDPIPDAPSFSIVSSFFSAVVESLRYMKNRVTLEFVQGDVTQELTRLRLREESSTPNATPRRYTRMWLSNVP